MKKLFLCLGIVLAAAQVEAGPPAVGSIPTIASAKEQLVKDVHVLSVYIDQINAISQNGLQLSVATTGDKLAVPASSQTNMMLQYVTLKQNVLNDVNALP